MAIVVPTILTSDKEEYHKRLRAAERASDLIQVDLIDGKFADNTTISSQMIAENPSSANLEIHLMVVYPQKEITELVKIDWVWRIIIPFEVDADLNEAIYQVKASGKRAALALKPETPVAAALHFLPELDLLLLLAVEPGFGGQKFQERVLDKVRDAKKFNESLAVEVDGGINFENVSKIAAAGADFVSANSVLWKADDFYLAYEKLAKLAM